MTNPPRPTHGYTDRRAVLYRNTADVTLTVNSDVFDEAMWTDPMAPRPARMKIPAGAVVAIKAEYALRRQIETGAVLPAVITQMAPQLKPDGIEAENFVANTLHGQLVAVAREFAKAEVQHVMGNGQTTKDAEQAMAFEQGRRAGIMQTLDNVNHKPVAELRFVPAATDDNHVE
ncbi:MAG TPA: hypothetical protein VGM90_14900 [Kofleriaceae bacterium]